MQNLPIYLYQNLLDVTLDMDATVRGVNRVMYQRDLTIQKGLKNQVRVQFKNSDQKKIRIYNSQTYVFSMYDAINQQLILEKPLSILDDATTSTKGLALLTLTESDTLDLPKSSYNFSIKVRDTDGSYTPAYSNTYYGINGTLHLSDDIFPRLNPGAEITNFTKLYNGTDLRYEHYSGNVYANPEFNGNSAMHTVAVYLTGFRGQFFVETTLENSPGVGTAWASQYHKTFSGFSGIDYVNITGVFSYIRIKFIPAQAPGGIDNDDPSYFGSVDKVLYRS